MELLRHAPFTAVGAVTGIIIMVVIELSNTPGEVSRALELAAKHADLAALREAFHEVYQGGRHVIYGVSQANEIVSKGLAVFAICRGEPREAIVAAVNFGRDTDCLAAVAGGLSGALNGPSALPSEWVQQVNEATRQDPYTNNKRTIEQTADGLLAALRARQERLGEYVARMGEA